MCLQPKLVESRKDAAPEQAESSAVWQRATALVAVLEILELSKVEKK